MQHRYSVEMVVGFGLLVVAIAAGAAPPSEQPSKIAVSDMSEAQLLSAPQRIPKLVAEGALTSKQVPNPHWRRDACQACHAGAPSRANLKLREADINHLCNNCHAAVSDHSFIHPTGMPVPASMQSRLSKSFQQAVSRGHGKITCITCHDLPMTCVAERARERGLNPLFFRDGPYSNRTELCYRCHDPAAYTRLNPHDQIDADGQLRTATCPVCHDHTPDVQTARSIADVDFTVAGDLSALCTGCHPVQPHPGGFSFTSSGQPDHLRVPSARVAQRRERMQQDNAIALPLDPHTGKVFCGTCHNPHARGVIRVDAAAKGASEKDRLRMPQMCGNCHDK
jgi:predicted CXXCH cytochrome family protein